MDDQQQKTQKRFRPVLVNLELSIAEQFHALAKSLGTNATKVTRKLITDFLKEHQGESR